MSLLSKQDHTLASEAIDFYLFSKGVDMDEKKREELKALLNWIKLQENR